MNFIDGLSIDGRKRCSVAMVQRRDTGVARHTGGWIVLGSGLLASCLLGAWQGDAISPANGGQSAPAHRLHGFPELRIDINQADEAELSCVAGIGPALARRIVEYRQRLGRFHSLSELDDVPGVGPQLARQLQSAIQPLPERDVDVAVTDPARLVGRTIKLPINEPLHD